MDLAPSFAPVNGAQTCLRRRWSMPIRRSSTQDVASRTTCRRWSSASNASQAPAAGADGITDAHAQLTQAANQAPVAPRALEPSLDAASASKVPSNGLLDAQRRPVEGTSWAPHGSAWEWPLTRLEKR